MVSFSLRLYFTVNHRDVFNLIGHFFLLFIVFV